MDEDPRSRFGRARDHHDEGARAAPERALRGRDGALRRAAGARSTGTSSSRSPRGVSRSSTREDFSLVDVGGRDIKFVRLRGRKVEKLDWNLACGSTTGATLELLGNYYDIDFSTLPPSDRWVNVTCGVFGMERVLEQISLGTSPEESVAMFLHGLVRNVIDFIGRPGAFLPLGRILREPVLRADRRALLPRHAARKNGSPRGLEEGARMNGMNASLRATLRGARAVPRSRRFALSSCRLLQRGSPADVGLKGEPTGTDLAVAARFVTPDDDVSGFFKKLMPDSGIIPVRVSIRNDGRRAAPHSQRERNEARRRASKGSRSSPTARRIFPLHPKEVVAKLLGAKKAGRYRRHGAFGFVAGTFFPPSARLSHVQRGRHREVLPAPLQQVVLSRARRRHVRAGATRARAGARAGISTSRFPKGVKPDSCELLVRASAPSGTTYSLTGCDFTLSRDELPFVLRGSGARINRRPAQLVRRSLWISLRAREDAGTLEQGLYFARVRALDPKSDSLWTLVTHVSLEVGVDRRRHRASDRSPRARSISSRSRESISCNAERSRTSTRSGISRAACGTCFCTPAARSS